MQVSIPFLNDSDCVNIYPEVKPEIKVCGGEYNKTTCNVKQKKLFNFYIYIIFVENFVLKGDSGGPFVVQSKNLIIKKK